MVFVCECFQTGWCRLKHLTPPIGMEAEALLSSLTQTPSMFLAPQHFN